ncbi:MAG: fibronectin type III domain-containing protein [Actinobacteria bacterium]|nr:fibronectin type III domain-containing protein [Actinomycetota bacterium]
MASTVLFSTFSIPAQADSAISVGTTTFGSGLATNVGVTLTGFDQTQNYQVTVKFVNTETNVDVTNGTLAATQGSTSLVSGYSSYSAAKLGFKGTYAAISAALSSMTWNPSSASGDISIRIGIATQPGTNEFYDANSIHYYKYISTGASWSDARIAAESTYLFGLRGYLAEINAAAENNFIGNETSASNIWIGATEDADTAANYTSSSYNGSVGQRWIWNGAVETPLPAGTGAIAQGPPAAFSSWAGGEPNNDAKPGQDCAVTNWRGARGMWNDLTCEGNLNGYLIEFGGRPDETSTASTRTLTTTVVAREAVTLGTLRSNVTCTFGVDCSFPLSLTDPTAKNSSNVDVAGTFAYTSSNTDSTTVSAESGGASVALVNAGTSTITATFTPTNTALYAVATKTFTITVTATAPAAPTGLSATAGNTQASLSWTAASNGGSAITDYLIEYSTDNSTWSTFADGTSTGTSATVTGLTNGILYYFRVSAINDVDTGSSSSAVSATPVAPSSGGGGVSPTPTPTPTSSTKPKPENNITTNPLTTPSEKPEPGTSNQPASLVERFIEDLADALKPVIVDIFSTPISTAEITAFTDQVALDLINSTGDKKIGSAPSLVLYNNEYQPSKLAILDNSIAQVVSANGGVLNLQAKDGETPIAVNTEGRVQMVQSNLVFAQGTGLAPNSEFAVYLFSNPTLLGISKTNAKGEFFISFAVKNQIPLGDHTLQVNGLLADGRTSSVSMPVTLVDSIETARSNAMPKTVFVSENPVTKATNALYFLIALFAALLLFMLFGGSRLLLAAIRRRDEEEANV